MRIEPRMSIIRCATPRHGTRILLYHKKQLTLTQHYFELAIMILLKCVGANNPCWPQTGFQKNGYWQYLDIVVNAFQVSMHKMFKY